MTRLVERAYAALLYLYPPGLRVEHADEMRACARHLIATRGARAFPGLLFDLLTSVPREWALLLKGLTTMTGLAKDISYALRVLRRSPGFTAAAVLTLALGIGANAAVFSLAEATLLRPLKVANPSELHALSFSISYPDYLSFAERRDMFSGLAGMAGGRLNAVADEQAELVTGAFVSGNYFGVLGVAPALGRVLTPADDERNGPGVAVITHRWWQTRFGGDPAVLGKTIRVNNAAVTVVGVAAPRFTGTSLLEPVKIFMPLTHTPRVRTGFFAGPAMLTNRGMSWVVAVARLNPGVTPAAGAAAMEAVYRQFHPLKPGARPDPFTMTTLRARAMGRGNEAGVSRFVTLLLSVVALTLLMGCANLANLLLSRAAARRREIGVRLAIGAGRARVARQLVIESLVLAAIGGTAGLVVGAASLRLLAAFQLPGGIEIDGLGLALSPSVLAYTAFVTIVTGVLFGSAPAWRASRADLLMSLRDDVRTASGRSGLSSVLVATQVAVSLVLLAGTALFMRSLDASLRVPLGFNVEGVATASTNLGAARYDAARAQVFYQEALDRARRLPDVTAAAVSSVLPTVGARSMSITVEGYQPAPGEDMHFYNNAVTPEYFKAIGTKILRGRAFEDTDTASAPLVAVINETAAKTYFAGRNPLGGRLQFDEKNWVEIVGVAEDTKVGDLDEKPSSFVYSPFSQDPFKDQVGAVHMLVRTTGDESALLGPLAEQLRAIDRNAPVYDVSTLAWRVRRLVMPQRMGAALFGAFGLLALVLAVVGVYGVASYMARLRTRELGIRIALGADRARIHALVLRQGTIPVAAGIAAGLLIAVAGGHLAASFLRGVTPRDPLTYAGVAVLLGAISLVATWLPARRAARLDPVRALRHD